MKITQFCRAPLNSGVTPEIAPCQNIVGYAKYTYFRAGACAHTQYKFETGENLRRYVLKTEQNCGHWQKIVLQISLRCQYGYHSKHTPHSHHFEKFLLFSFHLGLFTFSSTGALPCTYLKYSCMVVVICWGRGWNQIVDRSFCSFAIFVCVCVCVCARANVLWLVRVDMCVIPTTSITIPKLHKSGPHFRSDWNMATNIIMFITTSGIPMQQTEQPAVQDVSTAVIQHVWQHLFTHSAVQNVFTSVIYLNVSQPKLFTNVQKNSLKRLSLYFWCTSRWMSTITLCKPRYVDFGNRALDEIPAFWTVVNDCTSAHSDR